MFCRGRIKDYLLYILYFSSSFERKFDLLSHVLGYLEATRLTSLNDVEQILLAETLHHLLHSPLDPLLLMEEIIIEILLDVLLLLGEVHLLELELGLLLLKSSLLFGGRQMVVDDHSIDVVL